MDESKQTQPPGSLYLGVVMRSLISTRAKISSIVHMYFFALEQTSTLLSMLSEQNTDQTQMSTPPDVLAAHQISQSLNIPVSMILF